MTYRLLACAEDGAEAEEHLAVVARWTEVQADLLRRGKAPCADHERLVAEALAHQRLAATTGGRRR